MNYKQLVNAYVTLTRMGGALLDVKAAMSLYKVRKTLEPYYQFCVEREQLIMEQHGGFIAEGNVTFRQHEDAELAQEELNALYFTDVEDEFIPTEVSLESMKGCAMSLNDMEALDGIVVFT